MGLGYEPPRGSICLSAYTVDYHNIIVHRRTKVLLCLVPSKVHDQMRRYKPFNDDHDAVIVPYGHVGSSRQMKRSMFNTAHASGH